MQRAEQQEQQGTDWSATLKFLCKSPCLKLRTQDNHLAFLNKDWKSLALSNYSSNPCWYFTLEEIRACQALNSRKSLGGCLQVRLNRKHILANEIQLGTLTDAFALTAPRPDRSQISPPSPPLDVFGTVAEY